jgi:hypothetical protein
MTVEITDIMFILAIFAYNTVSTIYDWRLAIGEGNLLLFVLSLPQAWNGTNTMHRISCSYGDLKWHEKYILNGTKNIYRLLHATKIIRVYNLVVY